MRKADNLTAICVPIVYKMWVPRGLITLWASIGIALPYLFYTLKRKDGALSRPRLLVVTFLSFGRSQLTCNVRYSGSGVVRVVLFIIRESALKKIVGYIYYVFSYQIV
jgi:hypothetical protein